jgi:CRP-like cAMP-binding protein
MTQSPSSINLEAVISFLLETEIFSLLTPSELSEVTTILEFQRFATGETIFSEGDVGDAWYVLYEGKLGVSKHVPFKKDSKVATLSSPAVFGEMAILSAAPRSATIIARENVVVMRFARRKFERLLEEGKLGAYKLALGMGIVLLDRH